MSSKKKETKKGGKGKDKKKAKEVVEVAPPSSPKKDEGKKKKGSTRGDKDKQINNNNHEEKAGEKKKKQNKDEDGKWKAAESNPFDKEKEKKKKKKGTKKGKSNKGGGGDKPSEADVLHRGLSVADDEGNNLLSALSNIEAPLPPSGVVQLEPLDEEAQFQDFVKKLTSESVDIPSGMSGVVPVKSQSNEDALKLDSIDDALKALENWDAEDSKKSSNGSHVVTDNAADELDALLAEMGQSMDSDNGEKKRKEEEEAERKRKEKEKEEEEERKRKEQEEKEKEAERVRKEKEEEERRKAEEQRKEEERRKAEEQRKEEERRKEEQKKKAEEERIKKEEEEKKKREAELKAQEKKQPASPRAKSQGFKIEIEGVRIAESPKPEQKVTEKKEEEKEKQEENLPIVDRVRKEFIETEVTYVDGLSLIMKIYYRPLEISGLLRPKDIETIFYGISQIHDIHSNLLVDLLDAEKKAVTGGASAAFAAVLSRFVPFLKIYTEYINHFDDANSKLNKLIKKEKKFAAFIKECQARPECKSLDLSSYLISPIQRLPRYELLLRDYMKHSKDEKERKQIEALFNAVVDVNKYINQRKGDAELRKKKYKLQQILKQHKVDLFNRPDREFIKEGALKMCEIAEKDAKDILAAEGSMRITSIASRKLAKKLHTPFKDNYFFLFDDILIQVLISNDDGEVNYKYVRHYATQSISVETVTLNSPAVGVLLDPVDETACAVMLTWLTNEKSTEGDEFSGESTIAPSPGRESTRLYMRRFYLKAADPSDKREWQAAFEKVSALSIDGIIDNKVKRGTLKLPLSPVAGGKEILPSAPEEVAAYKDQMRKKYEEEQRKSTIRIQEEKRAKPLNEREAERLLSTLETRIPVMDVFKNAPPTTLAEPLLHEEEVKKLETGDIRTQMQLLDKELHTWETKRKEGTWGKSTVSPFAAAARPAPSLPVINLAENRTERRTNQNEDLNSVAVNDDELSALLKSLDEGTTSTTTTTPSPFEIREETVTVKSTVPTLTRTTSATSSSSSSSSTSSFGSQQPTLARAATFSYSSSSDEGGDKLSALERLQREQEAKAFEAQREAERLRRELEQEKIREKQREQERIEREIQEKFERLQREEAMKTAGVGALLCNFCFAPIGGAAYVKVGDKTYHVEHFNCVVCGIALAGKSFYPVGEDKKAHCTDCYNKRTAVQCHKCRLPITGVYSIVFEKNWHNECLVCCSCGTQFSENRLEPNKRMMSKDEQPICKGCFGKTWNQNRKCDHCGQAVISTTEAKMSPSLDRCWHIECFQCKTCSIQISDARWRDNLPYCPQHY